MFVERTPSNCTDFLKQKTSFQTFIFFFCTSNQKVWSLKLCYWSFRKFAETDHF